MAPWFLKAKETGALASVGLAENWRVCPAGKSQRAQTLRTEASENFT